MLYYIIYCNYYILKAGVAQSVVSGYRLGDQATGVRSPEAKDFSSSHCIQTSSEDDPASYPVGPGGPFPGGKERPGREEDHSPPI
jgi:hypothetical protein